MTDAEQLVRAIARVENIGRAFGGLPAIDMVCAAADIIRVMMENPVKVEWCDTHHRPHEFCTLVESEGCDAKLRAIGPEAGLVRRG